MLTSVWEAAGYPWSVRLKALLPAWMPWIRKRFKLNPKIEKQLRIHGIQAGSSAFKRTDQGYPAASHTLVRMDRSSCP